MIFLHMLEQMILLLVVTTDNQNRLDFIVYFSHSTLSNLFLIDTISADYGSYEFPVPDSILTDSAIIVMKI